MRDIHGIAASFGAGYGRLPSMAHRQSSHLFETKDWSVPATWPMRWPFRVLHGHCRTYWLVCRPGLLHVVLVAEGTLIRMWPEQALNPGRHGSRAWHRGASLRLGLEFAHTSQQSSDRLLSNGQGRLNCREAAIDYRREILAEVLTPSSGIPGSAGRKAETG
jgi:hypothetical protein